MAEEKIEYVMIPRATLSAVITRLSEEPYGSVAGLMMAIQQHTKNMPPEPTLEPAAEAPEKDAA